MGIMLEYVGKEACTGPGPRGMQGFIARSSDHRTPSFDFWTDKYETESCLFVIQARHSSLCSCRLGLSRFSLDYALRQCKRRDHRLFSPRLEIDEYITDGRMEKGISKEGVQFYHDLIDELLKNDKTPLVTVFHWDIPADLEDEYGGFLSERVVPDFVEYANFTFHEYGGKVKNWITFNEPWVFSRSGYDTRKKAPGRCSPYIKDFGHLCQDGRSGFEAYVVSHNLLVSHAEAVDAFRKCEKCKGGKIGIAHSPAWFEPEDVEGGQRTVDRVLDFIMGCSFYAKASEKPDYRQPSWATDSLVEFEHHIRTETNREWAILDVPEDACLSPSDGCDRLCSDSQNGQGINKLQNGICTNNSSFYAKASEKPDYRQPSWATDSLVEFEPKTVDGSVKIGSQPSTAKMAVYAAGLRKLVKYIKDRYGNLEIIITENGYGEDLGVKDTDHSVALNDHNRKYYHQRHLLALHQAICEDKVNVTSYFVWSLMDNFEWQDGCTARFGLYYIDFKNSLTRMEKESAKWFTEFLKPGPKQKSSKSTFSEEL
ncbi:hypothetical protein F2Q69_00026742 [Brassica cretica]|uniref:thioglucosidase n=1 Tax=Brassica cretica TaxID=69181 RepID=A0A8S9S430_BRACR|nr:hypothetical protein F2Q69_00026742 [Brassica cretica]